MGKAAGTRLGAVSAVLALTAVFSVVLATGGRQVAATPDRRAFDFALPDINPRSESHGQRLALRQLYGRRGLVLQFIASWCKPCRDELSGLQQVYAERAVPLVLVAADESGLRDSVLILAERHALTMPILFAAQERVAEIEAHYPYEILPATYFIDRRGRILRSHEGALGAERLARAAATELDR